MKNLAEYIKESVLDKSNKSKTMSAVDVIVSELSEASSGRDIYNAVEKMKIGKPGKRLETNCELCATIRDVYGDVTIDIPIPGANWCTADWGYDSSRRHAVLRVSLGSWNYYTVTESDEFELRANKALVLDMDDAVDLAYKIVKKLDIQLNNRMSDGFFKQLAKQPIWKPGTNGGKDITGHQTVRKISGKEIQTIIDKWLYKEDFDI